MIVCSVFNPCSSPYLWYIAMYRRPEQSTRQVLWVSVSVHHSKEHAPYLKCNILYNSFIICYDYFASTVHMKVYKIWRYYINIKKGDKIKYSNIHRTVITLLYLCKPDSLRKILLYATFKFFIAVLVELYQNVAQYRLQVTTICFK